MRSMLFLVLCSCSAAPAEGPMPVVRAAPTPALAVAPAVGADGPSHLSVPALGALSTDAAVIAKGEEVFTAKGCVACHAFGTKLVGPDLTDVTDRRSVIWITRMIRHPDAMTKEDPVAKGLLKSHMVQMPNQGVTDEELASMLAYLDTKKGS